LHHREKDLQVPESQTAAAMILGGNLRHS
jgi:hypothetical protein